MVHQEHPPAPVSPRRRWHVGVVECALSARETSEHEPFYEYISCWAKLDPLVILAAIAIENGHLQLVCQVNILYIYIIILIYL